MPTPFPGIDPFVEAQGRWTDFHPALIGYIRDSLNDAMPGSYLAQIGERLDVMSWSADRARAAYPDVMISRRGPAREGAAAVATLEAGWDPVTIPVAEVEGEVDVRYTWVEILHLPGQELVTSIELLSPANKVGYGWHEHVGKFRRMLRGEVHLVEIDLLLGGQRLPLARPYPPGDFCVTLARADRRPDCEVSAWSIRQTPPTIPIPLRAPDPDVSLDLAALVRTAYDRGRYDRALDYAKPLYLPMTPADLEWAVERAKAATQARP